MLASDKPLAVLVSGGLDSAVLLGWMLQTRGFPAVYPLYVRTGLTWETVEQEHLRRFLTALSEQTRTLRPGTDLDSSQPMLRPLVTLDLPVAELYGDHWSLTGRDVPSAETPDEAVYLPGRNVLLLSKALIWCHLHDVPMLALATLMGNPFPDATPEFFRSFTAAVNLAVVGNVQVVTPFAGLSKADVIRRGHDLPLRHSLSCLSPVAGRHCGRCNKCAERQAAFISAGVADPTEYGALDV